MKCKKLYVGYIVVVGCFTAMVSFGFNMKHEVKIVKSESSKLQAVNFLEEVAEVINHKDIAVTVDQQSIQFPKDSMKPFASNMAKLMYPVSKLSEILNCGVRVYPDNRILIEKSDITIGLLVDSPTGTLKNEIFLLSNPVIMKDKELYVPLQDISQILGYSYDWAKMDEGVVLHNQSTGAELPSKYDYREKGRVSAVRDQGPLGTCWAFASLGALETSILPTEEIIFSPDHMSLQNSFNLTQDEGGEYNMSIAYLASWQGPVLEKEDPYGDRYSPESLKAAKHLEEALILQPKDYKAIKRAVFLYGGVETSIYTSLKNSGSYSRYYDQKKSAYYFNGEGKSNHDIVIVGWDDDYSKSNFNIEPEGNGAFLCKNSWGTDFGQDGYFYVSYYDSNVGGTNVVYSRIAENDNYDNNYQSDLLGWTGQLGFNKEEAYFANVYTTKEEEILRAVSFYATGPNTSYEVYVSRDVKDENSLNNRKLLTTGNLKEEGYYTIDLPIPERLRENEKFAVIVKVKTKDSVHPVAVEYDADKRTSTFDITDGQGYISLYGTDWSSAEEKQNCNVSLKAFTDNAANSDIEKKSMEKMK